MTTLRHGDRSQAVRNLQKSLNQNGAKLTVDGDYGDATENAVRAYQLKVGLVPELTYTLEGVKPDIDEIIWYGGNVQHTLSADSGYTVSLELESKIPEDTVEGLAEENKGDFTGIVAYYRDRKTGREKTITAGDQSKPRRLRWLYASEKSAKRAVEREYTRLLQRAD